MEGPTAVKIGPEWWIWFDHYAKPQHYGALTTKDWKTFTDATQRIAFPAGGRHGTVARIPAAIARTIK